MNSRAIIEFHREIQSIIVDHACLQPAGAQSKTALSATGEVFALDFTSLSGLIEYEPSEYTFTALAGTPLAEVHAALAEHNQYLPFDPPLVEAGATLGGTVAAGLSGPGRYRFGGVRDFMLAVQYLDGQGRLVRSGAKVVKNSAGFDMPKLMVGSLGSLGALTELTLKVFPRPAGTASFQVDFSGIDEALKVLVHLTLLPLDLYALDLAPHPRGVYLLIRIGGSPASFPARLQRLKEMLGEGQVLEGDAEEEIWRSEREYLWMPAQTSLVKIPLTPRRVTQLDGFLSANNASRRYQAGANLAWVAWPGNLELLDRHLQENQLRGLVLLGSPGRVYLGMDTGGTFASRVKQAVDPLGRWADVARLYHNGILEERKA
jgi:glycolate oxidase FAD binding subunit